MLPQCIHQEQRLADGGSECNRCPKTAFGLALQDRLGAWVDIYLWMAEYFSSSLIFSNAQ